ncbi:MAG: peptidylprolyl isomerase [Anaerolineae bacterium]
MNRHRLLALSLLLVAALGVAYAMSGGGPLFRERTMACTLSARSVLPDDPSPIPPVSEDDWQWGPADARVTLITYLDLEDRHSAALAVALLDLRNRYPDDLRIVYRAYPLDELHPRARLAAQAVEAAGAQGQFWAMQDLLVDMQPGWIEIPPALYAAWLTDQARDLGLDAERFQTDLKSGETLAAIDRAVDSARALGLDGTPTLAINGHYYEGPMDAWTLGAYIELIKLEDRQFAACAPLVTRARREYAATLHTTRGDIVLALYPREAPLAVNSFVFLARQGWFDGVPFHRVIPEFAAQTGDPSGTGLGGPGYTFATEIVPTLSFDRAGVVGMANSGPDANGSQFFVTYAPQPSLDGKYTVFGRVTAGMDVAQQLTPRDPASDPTTLPDPDRIISVEIAEE